MYYGCLEAGGTKMICAVCEENGKIIEQVSIPTLSPEETIPKIIDYFKAKDIVALGVACFGPIDLHKDSKTYGYITSTPKLKWQNYPLLPTLQEALAVPMGFDTDVNGSLLGEVSFGSSKGIQNAIYITIGTGVGGGVISNGKLLHGMLHPELGHMFLVPHPEDSFAGHCPFHKNCFEGMAGGAALVARNENRDDRAVRAERGLGNRSLLHRPGALQSDCNAQSGKNYSWGRSNASGATLPSNS